MLKQVIAGVVVTAAFLFAAGHSDAADWVRGYSRSNGTYVQPYYRSHADGNFSNNWSTYPNVNPYTGQIGTRYTPSYGSGYPSYRNSYPSYRNSYSPNQSIWGSQWNW